MNFDNYRAIKTIHFTTETEVTLNLVNDGTLLMPIDAEGNVTGINGDNLVKMVSDVACTVTLKNASAKNCVVIVNGTAETVASEGTKQITLTAGVPQLVAVLFA